jgi:hypothetical protein
VFLEGRDFRFREPLVNPYQAVLDGLVHKPLPLLAEPGFVADECDHPGAHVGTGGGFEPEAAHRVKLENASIGAVLCLHGMHRCYVAFGQNGHFLHHAVHISRFECDGDQERGAVLRVAFEVEPEVHRGAPGHAKGRNADQQEEKRAHEIHGAIFADENRFATSEGAAIRGGMGVLKSVSRQSWKTAGSVFYLVLACSPAGAESAGNRWVGWWSGWWKRSESRVAAGMPASGRGNLEMTLRLEPGRIRLGVDRRIRVLVGLKNRGRRMCELEFGSSQRIEVQLVEVRRGVLETWSDDRRFEPKRGWVALNPGERLEYEVEVSAREIERGGGYGVEAWLADHPEVRASAALIVGD